MVLIEVCANSVDSALAAENGGAGRIELCSNLIEGGVTPSFAAIELACKMLTIPVNVLIRPRGGDFLYNDMEFSIIKRDIEICKNSGVHGVVIGILDEEGNIDMPRMQELVSAARPLSITFHRAFDVCNDPFKALDSIIQLGIERLLTSGQQNKAIAGIELIAQLVKKSAGKVKIMPGGGINRSNVLDFIRTTGVTELHMTGKKLFPSKMKFKKTNVSMNSASMPEYTIELTDAAEIKHIVSMVNTL